jgi:putative ABC transport system substrate-binding protein
MPAKPTTIQRRALAVLAAATLAAPRLVWAQTSGRTLRIGILAGDTTMPGEEQALKEGLRAHGFVEGRNLVIERGFAQTRLQELPGKARALAASQLDAVIATCTPTTRLAQQVFGNTPTSTPIVMAAVADPVGQQLISSLARPGANVTGRASQAEDLMGKQLELMAQVLGKPTTVAVLTDVNSAVHPRMFAKLAAVAPRLRLELVKVESGWRPGNASLSDAFDSAVRQQAGAVMVLPDEPFFIAKRADIVALAARHRVPAFYGVREFVDAGGLMSYGENLNAAYRSVADYLSRIAAGAKPGDLPVAQPTQFELVINTRTAKSLGVTLPQSVLLSANELVE